MPLNKVRLSCSGFSQDLSVLVFVKNSYIKIHTNLTKCLWDNGHSWMDAQASR